MDQPSDQQQRNDSQPHRKTGRRLATLFLAIFFFYLLKASMFFRIYVADAAIGTLNTKVVSGEAPEMPHKSTFYFWEPAWAPVGWDFLLPYHRWRFSQPDDKIYYYIELPIEVKDECVEDRSWQFTTTMENTDCVFYRGEHDCYYVLRVPRASLPMNRRLSLSVLAKQAATEVRFDFVVQLWQEWGIMVTDFPYHRFNSAPKLEP